MASQLNSNRWIVFLRILISLVWLANGLFCKVLNLVPRHQQIVGAILGTEYAPILTKLIGLSEIGMAIWVLSGFKPRECAIFQITIVVIMNIMEFVLVPDLLLWGRMNALFALLFVLLVASNEYYRTQTLKA